MLVRLKEQFANNEYDEIMSKENLNIKSHSSMTASVNSIVKPGRRVRPTTGNKIRAKHF
jgi:hypothetical protein